MSILRKVLGMLMLTSLVVNMVVGATLIWCVAVNKDFVPTTMSIYRNGEIVRLYQEALEYELPD